MRSRHNLFNVFILFTAFLSGDYAFTTASGQDTTPPTISNIKSSNITSSGATITWTTNEASDTQVEYGTSTGYGSSTTLNSNKVTSHSQNLTGLTASKLYHYRVKSKDASGNLAVSADNTFTTAAKDSGSFTISNLKSSDVSSTGVTISWTTNKAADSQIDFGFTDSYGNSTPLNSTMSTSHFENLTGLQSGTAYHYRVKSRDASGNLVTSSDHTFGTTTGDPPPVISNVLISEKTNRSARISWDTDRPSDSAVDYWPTDGTVRKSALDTFVTKHSLTLNDLKKETLYHFYIKSVDSENNEASLWGLSLTTLSTGDSVVALPRFIDEQSESESGNDIMIGIALTNMGADPASLSFTARDMNGDLIAGPDITNPGEHHLDPQNQSAILDLSVFGYGFQHSNTEGWIKMTSTVSDVGGFFLTFNAGLTYMDGTNLGDTPLKDFAFTEVETDGVTKIDVANNNPSDAIVTFNLMRNDGTIRGSQSRTVKANGALVTDLYGELFHGIEPDSADYVRMSSTEGLQSFELMKKGTADIASLTGQDVTAGGTTLYSPQYVVGGIWSTTLTVVNLDSRIGTVQFEFIGEDGTQIGETRTLSVPAYGKLLIDDPQFFSGLGADQILSGYVKITCDDVRLAGSTVFGDRNGTSFSSALPLISNLQESLLFSHVASNDMYFTGIAVVNPNGEDAYPIFELRAADGTLIERKEIHLSAKQRKIGMLGDFFASVAGKDQASGYIKILADIPLASFVLFGTNNMSVLSAIPPQVIQ
jgi:hypothetical protein